MLNAFNTVNFTFALTDTSRVKFKGPWLRVGVFHTGTVRLRLLFSSLAAGPWRVLNTWNVAGATPVHKAIRLPGSSFCRVQVRNGVFGAQTVHTTVLVGVQFDDRCGMPG